MPAPEVTQIAQLATPVGATRHIPEKVVTVGEPRTLRRATRLLVLTLLLAGFAAIAPAAPTRAASAPLPPTQVRVAWATILTADGPRRGVLLSWQASEPGATYKWSVETLNRTAWSPTFRGEATNLTRVRLLPHHYLPYRVTARLVVRAVVAGVSSAPSASPVFDTNGPLPLLTSIRGDADGSLHLTWAPQLVPDPNPGDPLDLPAGAVKYQLVGQFNIGEVLKAFGPSSSALTRSYSPGKGGLLGIAADNEWRPVEECCGGYRFVDYRDADYVRVFSTALTSHVPSVATYSLPMTITGTVQRAGEDCNHLECRPSAEPDRGRRVVLHGRNSAAGAWYAVTSTKTDANGVFRLPVIAPGTRHYRVLALGTSRRNGGGFPVAGDMSGPTATTTQTRVVSARFDDATATRGQRVTARLKVAPGGNQRATLQRRTGSAWVDLKWVHLVRGVGSYTFAAVQPGTASYRYIVPDSLAPTGLPVAAAASRPFDLRTR